MQVVALLAHTSREVFSVGVRAVLNAFGHSASASGSARLPVLGWLLEWACVWLVAFRL